MGEDQGISARFPRSSVNTWAFEYYFINDLEALEEKKWRKEPSCGLAGVYFVTTRKLLNEERMFYNLGERNERATLSPSMVIPAFNRWSSLREMLMKTFDVCPSSRRRFHCTPKAPMELGEKRMPRGNYVLAWKLLDSYIHLSNIDLNSRNHLGNDQLTTCHVS